VSEAERCRTAAFVRLCAVHTCVCACVVYHVLSCNVVFRTAQMTITALLVNVRTHRLSVWRCIALSLEQRRAIVGMLTIAIPSHTHMLMCGRWRWHSTDIVLSSTNITLIHRARGSHRSGHCPLPAALRHARTRLRVRFQQQCHTNVTLRLRAGMARRMSDMRDHRATLECAMSASST
jgi:hypothetical protein